MPVRRGSALRASVRGVGLAQFGRAGAEKSVGAVRKRPRRVHSTRAGAEESAGAEASSAPLPGSRNATGGAPRASPTLLGATPSVAGLAQADALERSALARITMAVWRRRTWRALAGPSAGAAVRERPCPRGVGMPVPQRGYFASGRLMRPTRLSFVGPGSRIASDARLCDPKIVDRKHATTAVPQPMSQQRGNSTEPKRDDAGAPKAEDVIAAKQTAPRPLRNPLPQPAPESSSPSRRPAMRTPYQSRTDK
jgi:hypothetical protein